MTTTENKKQNKGAPPPKARDKVWTVQENRPLDQMTHEICDAWKEDLCNIKQAFKKNIELSLLFKEMYNTLSDKTEKIDDFLKICDGLEEFSKIHQNQCETHMLINDMRRELLSLSNRIEYKPVVGLMNKIKALDAWMKNLDNFMSESGKVLYRLEIAISQMTVKKKWWQFYK